MKTDMWCVVKYLDLLCTRSCASGLWVGDCFIYNNSAWRLNYCVGGEVTTMFHLDRPMYLLGYLASQSKVYLIDKVSLLTFLLLSVVAFCTGCGQCKFCLTLSNIAIFQCHLKSCCHCSQAR